MAFNFCRTIFNVELETCKMIGAPYTPLPGSTLNEYYNVNTVSKTAGTPTLGYFGLGLRYDDLFGNDTLTMEDITKNPDDVLPERPVPFLAVKKSIGLTSNQRSQYRLIVEKIINGDRYLLCYLRKLPVLSSKSGVYDVRYVNGKYQVDRITYIDPTAHHGVVVKEELFGEDYRYLAYSRNVPITLTTAEINNIKTAIDLLYPNQPDDIKYGIGEVMLVTGIEVTVSGLPEIAMAQPAWFFTTDVLLDQIDQSKDYRITEVDIGGMLMQMKAM